MAIRVILSAIVDEREGGDDGGEAKKGRYMRAGLVCCHPCLRLRLREISSHVLRFNPPSFIGPLDRCSICTLQLLNGGFA